MKVLHDIKVVNRFNQGTIMKEKMAKRGYEQGDMKPTVESYQKGEKDFSQRDENKTTEYIERQDRCQSKMCKDVNKQAYKGRYS